MRHTLYAVVAASLAMLATSGIVAFATASPEPAPTAAERELSAHLDEVIAAQLDIVHARLRRDQPLSTIGSASSSRP